MMSLRRTDKNKNLIVALRNCITPKCKNTTQSFYCDECWERQQASRQTA
jgi:hypothetical protein